MHEVRISGRFGDAMAIAIQAHDGQVRKGTNIPYVAHVLAVASIALEHGADEELAIAALLHDVLEDGGPRFEPLIRQKFGERVISVVLGCTDGVPDESGQKGDWWSRKRQYLAHLVQASDDVLLVSGSDKLHNSRSIVHDLRSHGPGTLHRFTGGIEGTLWYYRELSNLFTQRGGSLAPLIAVELAAMEALAERG